MALRCVLGIKTVKFTRRKINSSRYLPVRYFHTAKCPYVSFDLIGLELNTIQTVWGHLIKHKQLVGSFIPSSVVSKTGTSNLVMLFFERILVLNLELTNFVSCFIVFDYLFFVGC